MAVEADSRAMVRLHDTEAPNLLRRATDLNLSIIRVSWS